MTSSQYGLEPGISHILHENISQDLKLPQANEFLVLSTYSKEKISEVVRKSFFLYIYCKGPRSPYECFEIYYQNQI